MRLSLCVALAASLALSGCGKKPPTEAAAIVDVTAVKVVPHDTPVSYEYVAQTQSANQVQIVARVNGFLDKQIYVEGSMVKSNQPMYQQDPKPFEATLSAAKAALAQQQARLQVATDNFNRVQPLVALNALAQKDLDDATGQKQAAAAAVDMAKASVEQAELNLGYTTIKSPVDGISSYSRVNVGSYIDAKNSLLTYVSPLDPMYVNFSISENDMLKLRTDQAAGRVKLPEHYDVEVILADGTTFDQRGRITFTDADFNQETGTFLIRATLPNPKSVLRPGQFVRARVLGAVRPNAILVPQAAVLQGAQGHFVVIVGQDNKAQIRPVQVGPWHGDEWFIDGGLETGDTVVVDGVGRLSPGTLVKVTGAPAASNAAPAAAS